MWDSEELPIEPTGIEMEDWLFPLPNQGFLPIEPTGIEITLQLKGFPSLNLPIEPTGIEIYFNVNV